MELLTIKEAIESKVFPLGHRRLRKLIYLGERKKNGEDVGNEYIRAVNLGSEAMPRWAIEKEEIIAWVTRKAKVKSKK